MTFDIGLHEVCVRVGVRYVITKFSRMDSLPNFLTHGAPLRESSAIIIIIIIFIHHYWRWSGWTVEIKTLNEDVIVAVVIASYTITNKPGLFEKNVSQDVGLS